MDPESAEVDTFSQNDDDEERKSSFCNIQLFAAGFLLFVLLNLERAGRGLFYCSLQLLK